MLTIPLEDIVTYSAAMTDLAEKQLSEISRTLKYPRIVVAKVGAKYMVLRGILRHQLAIEHKLRTMDCVVVVAEMTVLQDSVVIHSISTQDQVTVPG